MSKFRFFVIDDSRGLWTIFFKFLEILTTGSLEIGKFLQKQSVSIFRATGSFDIEKSENCWVLYIVTFSKIPLLWKTDAINALHSITKKNSKDRAGIEHKKMIAVSTACLFLPSLCTCWIASARVRAKTVFGHLKGPQTTYCQRTAALC